MLASPPGSYRWWYFDAVSDDGEAAATVIFFIGSVFSPAYAARLRRGEPATPEEHVAVNVALYRRHRQLTWVMSEYDARRLHRVDAAGPTIANSRIARRSDGSLQVDIDETSAPLFLALAGAGRPVRGSITLFAEAAPLPEVTLAEVPERHTWQVLAPRARVRVQFHRPAFSFEGVGYHDHNRGDGPLGRTFSGWSWARFHERERTTVLYATHRRHAPDQGWLLEVPAGGEGTLRGAPLLPEGERIGTRWGLAVPRWFALGDAARPLVCRVGALWETAPFYARYHALLEAPGRRQSGVGEYLDLDRFARREVQYMLRYRTRRRR